MKWLYSFSLGTLCALLLPQKLNVCSVFQAKQASRDQLTFTKCPLRHDGVFWTSTLTGALVTVFSFDPWEHQCYPTAVGGKNTGTTGQSVVCRDWAWTAQTTPNCQSDRAFFQFL